MAQTFDPTTDSWAPGEPIPPGMPSAGAASGKTDAVTADLAKVQREKVGAEEKVLSKFEGTLDKDMQRVEQSFKDEGASLQDPALKPWDEKQKQTEFQTDPIMAFGSLGSVFGILASAFTHAPMENALNASAAAITAIKKGDRQGYEDARKAWENNWKQAMDRHKVQHEQYQDAISLMKTNMAAGEARMRVLAIKFDDKKTLVPLEHGMSPEVIAMQAARETLVEKMHKIQEDVFKYNAEAGMYLQFGGNPRNPASPESVKAYEKLQEWKARLKASEHMGSQTPVKLALDRFLQEHPSASAEEISRFLSSTKTLGSSVMTAERQRASDVNTLVEKYKQQNPDATATDVAHYRAQQERELKKEATPITANRADDIQFSIDRIDSAEHIMDKIEGLLVKHNAISGLGGRITRGFETTAEVFGSNESDRKEFFRLVETLKLMGPRVLLDSKGRPLGAEADRIDAIIAGTNLGDLKPNTLRAYKELRDILEFKKKDMRKRLGSTREEPEKKEPPGGSWWKDPSAGRVVQP